MALWRGRMIDMNRRKLISLISIIIPGFVGLRTTAFGQGTVSDSKNGSPKSPHAVALSLVLGSQQEVIANAELKHFKEKGTDGFLGGSEQYWWHDIIERKWTLKRPFYPGGIDSSHWFMVSYSLGEDVVCEWIVDTRKRKVQLRPEVPKT